jgi:hypothetical protein
LAFTKSIVASYHPVSFPSPIFEIKGHNRLKKKIKLQFNENNITLDFVNHHKIQSISVILDAKNIKPIDKSK